jgi:hypothetical protein
LEKKGKNQPFCLYVYTNAAKLHLESLKK